MQIENGVLVRVEERDLVGGKFILPEGIKSIRADAFESCKNVVVDVDLSAGIEIDTIPGKIFYKFGKLARVVLPPNLKEIKSMAFKGCSELEYLELPEGLTRIPDEMCRGCEKLKEVIISTTITSKGSDAFAGCGQLSVVFRNGREEIQESLLENERFIKRVVFPDTIRHIRDSAFKNCFGIEALDLNEGVETIGKRAFYNCWGVKTVLLNEGIGEIEDEAFYNCSQVTEISFPQTIRTLGKNVCKRCKKLIHMEFPEGMTEIPEGMFQECESLETMRVAPGVKSLGKHALKGCIGLNFLELPEGMKEISDEACDGCKNLSTVVFPSTVQSWGEKIFNGCYKVKTIEFPKGIENIPSDLFPGLHKLRNLIMPNGEACGFNFATRAKLKSVKFTDLDEKMVERNISEEMREKVQSELNVNALGQTIADYDERVLRWIERGIIPTWDVFDAIPLDKIESFNPEVWKEIMAEPRLRKREINTGAVMKLSYVLGFFEKDEMQKDGDAANERRQKILNLARSGKLTVNIINTFFDKEETDFNPELYAFMVENIERLKGHKTSKQLPFISDMAKKLPEIRKQLGGRVPRS